MIVKSVEISNIERVSSKDYGMGVVLCTCGESLYHEGTREDRDIIIRAVADALQANGVDYQEDDWFPHWNGGKFGTQRRAYGFELVGFGVVGCRIRTVTVDEDGEEQLGEWTQAKLDDMPTRFRDGIDAAERAMREAVESIELPRAANE